MTYLEAVERAQFLRGFFFGVITGGIGIVALVAVIVESAK